MTVEQPLYTDRYRTPLIQLLTPAVAGVFVAWGALQSDLLLLLLGIGLGLFLWYTKHARYLLYQDRLVVRYGGPRQKVVPIADIESGEIVRLPMNGVSVLLRRRGGQPLLLTPSHPDVFLGQLEPLIADGTPQHAIL